MPLTQCPQTLHFWTDYNGGTERTLCSHEEDINRPQDIPVNSQAIVNLRTSRSFHDDINSSRYASSNFEKKMKKTSHRQRQYFKEMLMW